MKINQSKINFDDILSQTDEITAGKKSNKSQKSRKLPKNNPNVLKQQQKQLEMIENEMQEPERQRIIYVIQKYQSSEVILFKKI